MILYTENPKDSIRKLLELISEFSKVMGYKINTQKSLTFLYTNNEKSEREIKETIPFTIGSKSIKYLGINLHKETKELYNCINREILMKESKDDVIPNAIYRLNAIPMKIPMAFPHRTRIFFTIHMKKQKTPNSQRSLEKEAWSWRNQPS